MTPEEWEERERQKNQKWQEKYEARLKKEEERRKKLENDPVFLARKKAYEQRQEELEKNPKYIEQMERKEQKRHEREQKRAEKFAKKMETNPKFRAKVERREMLRDYYLQKHSVADITFEDYLDYKKYNSSSPIMSGIFTGYGTVGLGMALTGAIAGNLPLAIIGIAFCLVGYVGTGLSIQSSTFSVALNKRELHRLFEEYRHSDRFIKEMRYFEELKKDKVKYRDYKKGLFDLKTFIETYEKEQNQKEAAANEKVPATSETEQVEEVAATQNAAKKPKKRLFSRIVKKNKQKEDANNKDEGLTNE